MRRYWVVVFAVLCALLFLQDTDIGRAQTADMDLPEENEAPQAVPADGSRFLVELTAGKTVMTASDAMELELTLTNDSPEELQLLKVEFALPANLRFARGIAPEALVALTKPTKLEPGELQQFHLDFPYLSFASLCFPNRQLLLFAPGDYVVNAVVRYKLANYSDRTIIKPIALTIKTSISSLLYGGGFGAFIAAVFLTISNLYNSYKAETPLPMKPLPLMYDIGFMTFLGGLSAFITIVLLNRTNIPSFPITVTVNDFFGAVAMGLIANKARRWIYEQILNKD